MLLRWLVLLFLGVALQACRITDQQVNDEIQRRGGRIVTGQGEQLGGGPSFLIRDEPRELVLPPRIGITPGPAAGCLDCCWETVAREYLDGEPVVDPDKLEDDASLARELSRRAVNGYYPDVTLGNPPGQGPDGACDAGKRGRQPYFDAPNFPNGEFDTNPVKSRARVYVLEQETCLRCLNPVLGYLGCVKWYYVKVRNDDLSPPIIKLVTTGQVEPAPSQQFRDALDAWNRP